MPLLADIHMYDLTTEAPRLVWTHTEANAAKWRHLFDELIDGSTARLEGNRRH